MRSNRLKHIKEELSKSKPGIRRFLRNSFFIIISLWVMFALIIGVEKINTHDMTPALNLGDKIIYSRVDRSPLAQDVIVFEKNGSVCVARVVAIPGDTVEITEEGSVRVNGNLIVEEKIYTLTYPYADNIDYPLTLSAGEYFVLGDNRMTGMDSRYYGPVKAEEIKGTLILAVRQFNF
ncbi:MAG: signal peptidase I [Saccharofermentans sp.]|nr:signal peptidase I [Saccharofermentans sp.]